MRVNIVNPHTGKTILRNATVVATVPATEADESALIIVKHRNERFLTAHSAHWAVEYVARTRTPVAA